MADNDQTLGTIGLVQRWKEFVTGIHVRLMGAALYGISSGGSSEIPVKVSSGGGIYVELQPSTELVGLLAGSTAVIGHIIADASTARIGSLYPSTEIIGGLYESTAKIGALQASTEVIGFVSGHMTWPSVAMAVTTSQAYSSGDCIGGSISLASAFRSTAAMTGILQSLFVTDRSSTTCQGMTFVFFDTQTTGSTFTNDAALTVADGDLPKIIAKVAITSGDYTIFADNAVAVKDNLGIPVRVTTGTTLYAVAQVTSTGLVYVSTGDVNLKLGILAD